MGKNSELCDIFILFKNKYIIYNLYLINGF